MTPSYSSSIPVLAQARSNICNLLALISTNPKPTYSINGQSVQWTEYFKMLTESLKTINEQIQVAGGPFELQTQAIGTGAAGNGYFAGPI